MASTGQQPAQVVQHDKPAKHVHHGRTVAAWVGTTVAMVAFPRFQSCCDIDSSC